MMVLKEHKSTRAPLDFARGRQEHNIKGQGLLIIASAFFLILSFPNFNFYLFTWIGLVPLLFAIENKTPDKAFLVSYIAGLIFFLTTISWLMHVTLPGLVIVSLYLALYFGIFGAISSLVLRVPSAFNNVKGQLGALFIIPAAWVASEWLRSNVLGGFGWALLAHSQSANLPIIQISDMLGAYSVSFLIVVVNVAIFLTIKNFREKEGLRTPILLAGLLIFASLTYGYFRLNNIFTGERLRVGIIQGNIPQDKKWDAAFKEYILNKYESLTKELAKEKADLIIWPETAVPGYLESETDILERIKILASSLKTPLLVGSPRDDKIDKNKYYNSALLFSEEGAVIGSYDKTHLVPFGEYVPFKKLLSFVENFARSPIGDFSKGREYTVLKFFIKRSAKGNDYSWKLIKKIRFSCLICFEDIFPDISRAFVRNGAAFLVNMTNDAWFKMSSAPYQHAESSVFRAVENRVNVIRATNTGLSCFIDQKGRIVDTVSKDGQDLFVDGYKIHEIVMANTRTFYTIHGDIFAFACLLFIFFYLVRTSFVAKR